MTTNRGKAIRSNLEPQGQQGRLITTKNFSLESTTFSGVGLVTLQTIVDRLKKTLRRSPRTSWQHACLFLPTSKNSLLRTYLAFRSSTERFVVLIPNSRPTTLLMTVASFNFSASMPLAVVSAAVSEGLGYEVNYEQAGPA